MRRMDVKDGEMMNSIDLLRGVAEKSVGDLQLDGSDAYKRSLAERVRVNREILKNPYWFLPVDSRGHESFVPVGRGVVTNDFCGRHKGFKVCSDVESHKGVVFKGVDYTDKFVVSHDHFWCHKSSCPKCFLRGWCVRLTFHVYDRLKRGVDKYGLVVEHACASVPREDWGLPFDVVRDKVVRACLSRGVIGSAMIFHGYRIDRSRRVLTWGSHFHLLCFIEGGFDVCRKCRHSAFDCHTCDEYKGREWREWGKDKYIVKVFGERENLRGTIYYQLNHATIRMGVKRFPVVTYFGLLGYNKLKVKARKFSGGSSCHVCESVSVRNDMERAFFVGEGAIATDIGSPSYAKTFGDDPKNWRVSGGDVNE